MGNNNFTEKRAHRRLKISLPIKFYKEGIGRSTIFSSQTINVSTGGTYFETTADDFEVGDRLALELGIPTDDTRFPLPGKIVTVGQVLRRITIEDTPNKNGLTFSRYGLGMRFQKDLNLQL